MSNAAPEAAVNRAACGGVHGSGGDREHRGVGESIRVNVVLTLVEVSGLALVIVGGLATFNGRADFSRVIAFETTGDKGLFLALTTAMSLAFFAMIGFEDSVASVALVPVGALAASVTPLVDVVTAGAPGLPMGSIMPFISMFAVANSALINVLMASRLVHGMAKQRVVPPLLGRVGVSRRTPWVAIGFTTAPRSTLQLLPIS